MASALATALFATPFAAATGASAPQGGAGAACSLSRGDAACGALGSPSWREALSQRLAARRAAGQSATRRWSGGRRLRDASGSARRPFRIGAYPDIDPTVRTQAEIDYIMEDLVPASSYLIGASVRARVPLGPLDFTAQTDFDGNAIPNNNGAGFDVDLLVKVSAPDPNSELCSNGGAIAAAFSYISDPETNRPVFGEIILCSFTPGELATDLQFVAHELIHALGFADTWYALWRVPSGASVTGTDRGRTFIVTPMVHDYVQRFFGCCNIPGAELEDDGGSGSAGSHWEARIFEGELMDSAGSTSNFTSNKQTLTDLTLSLLQDTGWYDVKYGSAGLLPLGYGAGCRFALGGRFSIVRQDPRAAPYVCDDLTSLATFDYSSTDICTPDARSDAICYTDQRWDGFSRPDSFFAREDCTATSFERCLAANASGPATTTSASSSTRCVTMGCGADNAVTVNGEPCDPSADLCPDADLMCVAPGWLTCAGGLNDCNGRGACAHGKCYCFTGYGGLDCNLDLCVGSCPDRSPCPVSGFCGETAECGWSSGRFDRGRPCVPPGGTEADDGLPERPVNCSSPLTATASPTTSGGGVSAPLTAPVGGPPATPIADVPGGDVPLAPGGAGGRGSTTSVPIVASTEAGPAARDTSIPSAAPRALRARAAAAGSTALAAALLAALLA